MALPHWQQARLRAALCQTTLQPMRWQRRQPSARRACCCPTWKTVMTAATIHGVATTVTARIGIGTMTAETAGAKNGHALMNGSVKCTSRHGAAVTIRALQIPGGTTRRAMDTALIPTRRVKIGINGTRPLQNPHL